MGLALFLMGGPLSAFHRGDLFKLVKLRLPCSEPMTGKPSAQPFTLHGVVDVPALIRTYGTDRDLRFWRPQRVEPSAAVK